MKQAWYFFGKVVFYISWPVSYLYLARSTRTRLIIICDDEVLVVKGWLGGGWWGLPGGGLHSGEVPEDGAIRELYEETGIEVNATKLQKIFVGKIRTEHKLHYTVYAYGVRLKNKPEVILQKFELTHVEWMSQEEILNNPKVARDVRKLVRGFI